MTQESKHKITLFHCINSFQETALFLRDQRENLDLTFVKMACSSMVKDIFILKAFESGADAVIVMVCPEGHCLHMEGNIRALKRVKYVQDLLDEIGLDQKRLAMVHVSPDGFGPAEKMIQATVQELERLGPNPAA